MNPYSLDYTSKAAALALLVGAGGPFDKASIKLFLVANGQIQPDGERVLSETQPGNGLDANKSVTTWSAVSREPGGAVYVSSNLISWTPTADPVDETVRGVGISSDATFAHVFSYATFDGPEHVLYANQPVNVVVEVGFSGDQLYVAARHVPNGL